MDFDILSFLLGMAVGLGIAYVIVYQLGKALYRRLEAAVEEHVEEQENKKIDMKVEQHGDMLYAFRSDNDGFVCQGSDLRELRTNFLKRFPGHVGGIIGKTDELHQELQRQLKEIKNESSTGVGSSS